MPLKKATLKVSGIGCGSCVAPSKAHLLRVPGVVAVYVFGSRVEVVYDEERTSLDEVLKSSGVNEYYFVQVLSVESVDDSLGASGRSEKTETLRLNL
ncbi:heavy-metal-associated domain-containing protein [Thermofilum pendens]|uniref:HMA domain-containing protein n=1 Tax=Thermofilum pendens (strain DSM 2475 / Hrk 5) TaxID=368408 RepID=A1S0M2_THEPD|nr:heavy-metal-associated domain-containing protein [Thermofilum pendens]ABL79002.1 hypothetical protein Tpen_1607 [Thermofilum pendens Hrk 5]